MKRILTLHPEGKQGVNIEVEKYEAMRAALLEVIPSSGEGVRFQDLAGLVRDHLDGEIFGPDVGLKWYVTTVKQDLEARGMLTQVEGARPQRLLRNQDLVRE